MDRAASAARFVAVATAIYILMLSLAPAPARAWTGAASEAAPSGALGRAMAELGGSWEVSASLLGPLAVAILISLLQAVSRAASR